MTFDRTKGIGASDAAAVCGVDPFKTKAQLYHEKRGNLPPVEVTGPMKRGLAMERFGFEWFEAATGLTVHVMSDPNKDPFTHAEHPFIYAHPDGMVHSEKSNAIVEIKFPGIHNYLRCKREQLLDYYVVQVQHQMMVTGAQMAYVVICNAEYWGEPLIRSVEADEEFQADLLALELVFWGQVQAGEEPEEAKGEEIKVPKLPSDYRRDDSLEWVSLVRRLADTKALKDSAGELYDETVEEIKAHMGQQGVIEGGDARVFWRAGDKGKNQFDQKRFRKEHPDMADEFTRQLEAPVTFRPYFFGALKERSNASD